MTPGPIVARHFETGRWIGLEVEGDRIASVEPFNGPALPTDEDLWIAPAFWDLQVNGRLGVSFSSPELTVDQVGAIVEGKARSARAGFARR